MDIEKILEAIQQQTTLITNISNRLQVLEDEKIIKQDSIDEIYKEGVESILEEDVSSVQNSIRNSRRRTTIENLSMSKKPESIVVTHVVNIPSFDGKISEIKPRSVINFLGRVETYETAHQQKANLSNSFTREVQQELIGLSEGEYNNTTVGTITIQRFISIVRKHLEPKTQSRFLIMLKQSIYFPYCNVKEVNTNTVGELRNCIKKYSSDFLMIVELLSSNKSSIPPITNNKETGLIYFFNDGIPFGFGHGVFNQIGFKSGVKQNFKTIEEYINKFNNRIDEWYDLGVDIQPMFDAIKYPEKLPEPKQNKPKYFNKAKQAVNNLEEDNLSMVSKASSMTSSDKTNPELYAVHPDMKGVDRSKMPCHQKAIEKDCKRPECKYSHDEEVIQKYRDHLLSKLLNKEKP